MHANPSEVLSHFYAITPEEIMRDLRDAEGQLDDVIARMSTLNSIKYTERTAPQEAQIAHYMMVQAHELCRSTSIAREFKVFYASFGAGNIVNLADELALDQGRQAEIMRQMESIRQREGMKSGEDFTYNQGPPDHQKLEAESDRISDGIVETLMVSLLNRYHLPEEAKLYEQDRRLWKFLREVGGRVIVGSEPIGEQLVDRYLAGKYGQQFVEQLRDRVTDLRNAPSR